MQRWMDALGIAGVIMLAVGLVLFFSGSVERASWMYWIGGPTLWFLGFALVVGWLLLRWSTPRAPGGNVGPK